MPCHFQRSGASPHCPLYRRQSSSSPCLTLHYSETSSSASLKCDRLSCPRSIPLACPPHARTHADSFPPYSPPYSGYLSMELISLLRPSAPYGKALSSTPSPFSPSSPSSNISVTKPENDTRSSATGSTAYDNTATNKVYQPRSRRQRGWRWARQRRLQESGLTRMTIKRRGNQKGGNRGTRRGHREQRIIPHFFLFVCSVSQIRRRRSRPGLSLSGRTRVYRSLGLRFIEFSGGTKYIERW